MDLPLVVVPVHGQVLGYHPVIKATWLVGEFPLAFLALIIRFESEEQPRARELTLD